MPPVVGNIIGDVINGASSLLSTALSNKNAVRLMREQNEYNTRMWEKQRDFATSMYERTNAYNTPMRQRLRYEQAGINPYLALSNISSGSAQSVNAPNAAPSAGASLQAYDLSAFGKAASDFVSRVTEQNYMRSQTRGQDLNNYHQSIENDIAVATRNVKIARAEADLKKLRIDGKISGLDYKFYKSTLDSRIKQQSLLNDSLSSDISLKSADLYNKEMTNAFMVPMFRQQLSLLKEQVAESRSRQSLNYITGQKMLSEVGLIERQIVEAGIVNANLPALKRLERIRGELSNSLLKYENRNASLRDADNWFNKFLYYANSVVSLGSSAVGAAVRLKSVK